MLMADDMFRRLPQHRGQQGRLADLMQVLTQRARFLTSGGTPPDLGIGQPPSDSDVLGPSVPADGLTVTTSVGSSLFDERFGLGQRNGATGEGCLL